MKEKVALVTGGTSGIGKEIVKQLLKEECFVFVNFGHSEEMMYEAKKELSEISMKIFAIYKLLLIVMIIQM